MSDSFLRSLLRSSGRGRRAAKRTASSPTSTSTSTNPASSQSATECRRVDRDADVASMEVPEARAVQRIDAQHPGAGAQHPARFGQQGVLRLDARDVMKHRHRDPGAEPAAAERQSPSRPRRRPSRWCRPAVVRGACRPARPPRPLSAVGSASGARRSSDRGQGRPRGRFRRAAGRRRPTARGFPGCRCPIVAGAQFAMSAVHDAPPPRLRDSETHMLHLRNCYAARMDADPAGRRAAGCDRSAADRTGPRRRLARTRRGARRAFAGDAVAAGGHQGGPRHRPAAAPVR